MTQTKHTSLRHLLSLVFPRVNPLSNRLPGSVVAAIKHIIRVVIYRGWAAIYVSPKIKGKIYTFRPLLIETDTGDRSIRINLYILSIERLLNYLISFLGLPGIHIMKCDQLVATSSR
jgi:hypothetical protein